MGDLDMPRLLRKRIFFRSPSLGKSFLPVQEFLKPDGFAVGPRLCGDREFPFLSLLNIFEVFWEFVLFVIILSACLKLRETNDS